MQVILQSETIQELTKTSQALAALQDEASELRKLADARGTENVTSARTKLQMKILISNRPTIIADYSRHRFNFLGVYSLSLVPSGVKRN